MGFLIGAALHALAIALALFLSPVVPGGVVFLVGIGLTQLLYLIPAFVVFLVKRRPRSAIGVSILAGVTFLLNAACFGLVARSF